MTLTADQLADLLRDEIRSGALAEGARLPSIRELRDTHSVGKNIAENAVKKLQVEGLVLAKHGAGNWVQGSFSRRTEILPILDQGIDFAVQRVDEVGAPVFVAIQLKVNPGDPVVWRQERREMDGRAVELLDAYLPVDIARGTALVYHDTGEGGVPARLADAGFKVTDVADELVARRPTRDEAQEMRLRRDLATVFEVKSAFLAGDRCVEVTRRVLDADAIAFEVRTSV